MFRRNFSVLHVQLVHKRLQTQAQALRVDDTEHNEARGKYVHQIELWLANIAGPSLRQGFRVIVRYILSKHHDCWRRSARRVRTEFSRGPPKW